MDRRHRSQPQTLADAEAGVTIDLGEVQKIKATYAGHQLGRGDPLLASRHNHTGSSTCFDAGRWLTEFAAQPTWRKYSQGDQDAVLASLFSAAELGATNRYFVEFGFPDSTFDSSYGNGRNLRESLGFRDYLLLDGSRANPSINLHSHFLTAGNVVGIFGQYHVPPEPDYVSVDIDSCDLWLFHAITSEYRPRLVTVEYNSNYALGDYTTQRCADSTYSWKGDNIYGASLSAIELAARHRGYTLVYATPKLDLFLVRDDLLCAGSGLPVESFAAATSLPLHHPYAGHPPKEQLLMNFRDWLANHPQASSGP